MKYFHSLVFGLLFFAASAVAQQFSWFGGYTYVRANAAVATGSPAPALLANMREAVVFIPPGGLPVTGPLSMHANLNGWNTSLAFTPHRWFGVVADFSGAYGTTTVLSSKVDVKLHSFLFGPRIAYPKLERVTPFVQLLFGGAHGNTKEPVSGFADKDTGFAMSTGGGLDVKVSPLVSIRAFQADYYHTRLFGDTQHNFRLSTGVVFRFGKK